ncbi:MAG: 4-alpha-glucanotransferase [Sphingomonadales bacterium]
MPLIQFNIRYTTHPGQTLWISGNLPELGRNNPSEALCMRYVNQQFWQLEVPLSLKSRNNKLHYRYLLKGEDGQPVAEWGNDRVLSISNNQDIVLIDTWNFAGEYENAFYTAPFREVLFKRKSVKHAKSIIEGTPTHTFRVKAPLLEPGQTLCLLGAAPVLGAWNTQAALPMHKEKDWYQLTLKLPDTLLAVDYKYGVWDLLSNKFVRFEEGINRTIPEHPVIKGPLILHDGFVRLTNNSWKGAGVAIPVFSLRSKNSFGVGEFSDIKLLADWAARTGLRMIQLLPVNDTIATHSWIDSYPYAAISAFALHPLYINLAEVAGTTNAKRLRTLRKLQEQLNASSVVDYETVIKIKLHTLRELYDAMGAECFASAEYLAFFSHNKHWLQPYAVFCDNRDLYGSCVYEKWPRHAIYDQEEIDRLFASRKTNGSLGFYCFVQFHLHRQLAASVAYAHQKGVVLKGDIPIGIYRYSVDAWVAPDLYNMNWQAGAPPDDFTAIGQNWGFPTYNWGRMQQDDFLWWRLRFEQMSHYFDSFRIDHILGFFRIWSIPTHAVQGLLGRFVPCLPVSVDEFFQRNIAFDPHRYCQPYINEETLLDLFGEDQFWVREQFLLYDSHRGWMLSSLFDTQQKVVQYFSNLPADPMHEKVKNGLLQLIANVLLFEEPESEMTKFHFRISMEKTTSFRYLDKRTQEALLPLYHDYFYYRQDSCWYREAMQKLPKLKAATNMLVCGEDLGMVPHCVPDVMNQNGIFSLEIQRMPKDPAKAFFNPADAPYLSVVTPSTHDMSTIRGWWEENRERTQLFYRQEMQQWGEASYFCEAWINRSIVQQHLQSPAMWSVFQLQDLMGIHDAIRRQDPREERINDPANPRHYWQYRMHIYLEDLLLQTDFNDTLREMIVLSGRA